MKNSFPGVAASAGEGSFGAMLGAAAVGAVVAFLRRKIADAVADAMSARYQRVFAVFDLLDYLLAPIAGVHAASDHSLAGASRADRQHSGG